MGVHFIDEVRSVVVTIGNVFRGVDLLKYLFHLLLSLVYYYLVI